ncbi:hypothetical protein I5W16_11880 [Stenotrophomonas maltophilia]|nr:hypothetical protein [Stenotrophomonas maltophilia]MBH1823276.1 hypothetical protein [Stenotrophomonas maltophilia]
MRAGKQASRQAGKQASRQAGKQAKRKVYFSVWLSLIWRNSLFIDANLRRQERN